MNACGARASFALASTGPSLTWATRFNLDRSKTHDLDVVVDRLQLRHGIVNRLTDSVELALKLGEGRLLVQSGDEEPVWMSERFACIDCGISLPPIEPRMFSFNGPHGACPVCDGLGSREVVDPHRCTGDERHTLREGVVLAWGRRASVALATELARAVESLGVNPDVPWSELPEAQRDTILFGKHLEEHPLGSERRHRESRRARRREPKAAAYVGIVPRLENRLAARADGTLERPEEDDGIAGDGGITDEELGRFLTTRICEACKGKRLRPEALAVALGERDIARSAPMPLRQLKAFVESLEGECSPGGLGTRERIIAEPLLKAIAARLGFLIDVGLDYLTLDRSAQTLSSGEGQRIRLATQIGAALVGVSTFSTSRASDCTRETMRGSSRPRLAFGISATPSLSSSTTATRFFPPTTSWTWAPARAYMAARSSRRERLPKSWRTPNRLQGHG